MTKRELENYKFWVDRMERLGIGYDDAMMLRRAEMTLSRWAELECGDGRGHIERDETTGKLYYYNDNHSFVDPHDPRARRRIADRETGALKRIEKLLSTKYPHLTYYHQGDPRGCSLYVMRIEDVKGLDISANYSSKGVCCNY